MDDGEQPYGDKPEELLKRPAHRCWVDVTMRDSTMIGVPARLARTYLDPDAFHYYLPSLLDRYRACSVDFVLV